MAKCIIGGKSYTIPELNFIALERSWPFIEASMEVDPEQQPMLGPAAGISVIAAGLCEAETFKREDFGMSENEILTDEEVFERVTLFLKKKLKASEISNIVSCLNDIQKEAGLLVVPENPPAPPEKGENPSEEISPQSSPSSLQPGVREEAGTV